MTEPTDAELDAVLYKHWPAFSMQATLVRMWVRAAMRAAIVKWGTPPAEQQAMESVLVDGAASQPPISNTLWRMLTGGYEHTYILQLPNDSRDRRELIDRACHNWRRICAEIGNSAVASAVSPQTAQAPQQAAPKAAPGEPIAWTPGPNLFKDWCAQWFGPDSDDDYLAKAVFNLPPMAQVFREAAPQQDAQEPALFVSAKQLADLVDPSHATGGSYLPARKTRAGLFTQPLYSAPQPAPAPLSEQDPLQGAANWLVTAHPALETSTLAGKLSIGYNRAKRLHDAARKQGGA